MSTECVIEIQNVSKSYGKHKGVESLNLKVKKGEVFGYLGPNGAGKTTTIRLMLDLIRPTHGKLSLLGLDLPNQTKEIHSRIGYLPGELFLYDDLTGEQFLTYVGHLRGGVDLHYMNDIVLRLGCDIKTPIKSLSHGNRQKIGLVQSLIHKPELLILDEPTLGLDPLVQQEFYDIIEEINEDGCTVFLSSHFLPEVERVCDRVGIIRNGNLVAVEKVDVLKSRAFRKVQIIFSTEVSKDIFAGLEGVQNVAVKNKILTCEVVGKMDSMIKRSAQFEVVNIISNNPTLEDVFLSYYRKGHQVAK